MFIPIFLRQLSRFSTNVLYKNLFVIEPDLIISKIVSVYVIKGTEIKIHRSSVSNMFSTQRLIMKNSH